MAGKPAILKLSISSKHQECVIQVLRHQQTYPKALDNAQNELAALQKD
jgi:hypothetical protein